MNIDERGAPAGALVAMAMTLRCREKENEKEKGFLPALTANLDMRALITGYVSVGLVEIRLNRHCPNGLQPLVGG